MERWNGKWNGTCTQLYASVRHVVVQGCASYYVSVALISPQRLYEQVQCCQHSDIMVKTRGPCDRSCYARLAITVQVLYIYIYIC